MKKNIHLSLFISFVFIGLSIMQSCNANNGSASESVDVLTQPKSQEKVPVVNAFEGLVSGKQEGGYLLDFKTAAKKSVDAVVHVKSLVEGKPATYEDLFLEYFFGYSEPKKQEPFLFSTGSGVIISEDGYIVTNYHVIKGADRLLITMNDRREYEAEIAGIDSRTDLALLKINEKNLPKLDFGSSDDLELGEWVLAIGNPFRLSTTVTAGIVSAKARNINLISGSDRTAIESFIQTDAAVNPGNSGGALVNLKGELVGINTAIASPTGAFAGYSFAIPASIVSKVVDDLRSSGRVQRGVMGVTIATVDKAIASQLNLNEIRGVLINGVYRDGAAYKAGILPGDVIIAINGKKINDVNELQERVARYSPGDQIELKVLRKNEIETFKIKLRSSD